MTDKTAKEALGSLSRWFAANKRALPWRKAGTSPWGILVSEVMSQQTPMSRVAPYWISWMEAWPTPAACAQASSAEILTAWGHLGYPRRALNLQACAAAICERFNGAVPNTYDDLIALPGIGPYTASAVLSFAFGVRCAVVDTNIRRVLSRAFDGEESVGGATTAADRARAQELLPVDPADAMVWNQAVMELGATVCTAANPQCEICPLAGLCAWKAAGFPGMGVKRTRPAQKWKGTNRQVRGIVLNALRQKARAGEDPILEQEDLAVLWPDSAQLHMCVAALDNDGLIDILPGGAVTFPSGTFHAVR